MTGKKKKQEWKLYLITNGNRTYIGVTTDLKRRVRQHNREIVGGAKSTHWGAPNWKLHMHVEGFSSKSEVMRWEKIIKARCRGMWQRTKGFIGITHGKCPEKGRLPMYAPPENLAVIINVPDHLRWRD